VGWLDLMLDRLPLVSTFIAGWITDTFAEPS
jgi:hypothetical protein